MLVNQSAVRDLVSAYLSAKRHVIDSGYAHEIDWQDDIDFEKVTESIFLREAAWVILSSGMREYTIRKKFSFVTESFYFWASAKAIYENQKECTYYALKYFNNRRKIEAINTIACHIYFEGFSTVKAAIKRKGIEYISEFPFMGPATSYHLAKNIGLDVVKPDRHLLRVSREAGYNTPDTLCADISQITGEKVSVIDLVIWRYATLNKDYLNLFSIN